MILCNVHCAGWLLTWKPGNVWKSREDEGGNYRIIEKSGKGVSQGISVNGLAVWCSKQLLKTELLSSAFRPVDHLFTKNVLVTCLMASQCLIKCKS